MRVALFIVLVAALASPVALAGSGPPRQGVTVNPGTHGKGPVGEGASLYAANCSSCHGANGEGVPKPRPGAGGVPGQGPSLRNVGALAPDFYLHTGYMPLEDPQAQPSRSRVLFTEREIRAMVAYIATLGTGPAIPHPQPQLGRLSSGMQLFTDHCAGCHQEVGRGGYVKGARVPPLNQATAREIAEAVRIGPYLMPRFSEKAISNTQLNDLIAYVQYAKHPDDRGGWSIGDLGPWPEGMVSWLLATSAIVFVCTLLGRRLRA
jgi:ubiquinol-cytochrome c reductase cytochrome c subunit